MLTGSISYYAQAFESTPYGGFRYGDMVRLKGNLQAAGVDYGEETAILVKVEHRTQDVTPGSNAPPSPYTDFMVFNIYNVVKRITSGDRGYMLVPREESIVKHYARYYNGNPDYVWESINTGSTARVREGLYDVIDGMLNTTKWVNLATIGELSGAGGGEIIPTNYHSPEEWGRYHSGNIFD